MGAWFLHKWNRFHHNQTKLNQTNFNKLQLPTQAYDMECMETTMNEVKLTPGLFSPAKWALISSDGKCEVVRQTDIMYPLNAATNAKILQLHPFMSVRVKQQWKYGRVGDFLSDNVGVGFKRNILLITLAKCMHLSEIRQSFLSYFTASHGFIKNKSKTPNLLFWYFTNSPIGKDKCFILWVNVG